MCKFKKSCVRDLIEYAIKETRVIYNIINEMSKIINHLTMQKLKK